MTLWIVGAGGFGRETLDALLAGGQTAEGFVDDHRAGEVVRGLQVVHATALTPDASVVIAIADPSIRARLAAELGGTFSFGSVVHPAAIVGPETILGEGAVVLGGAHISSSVTLGSHVHVNYNATVGHDVVAGTCVTILPGANVGGSTVLGDRVLVGSNATVLQGLRIGEGAVIGAGAVVTRDVAAGTTVVGVPARPVS